MWRYNPRVFDCSVIHPLAITSLYLYYLFHLYPSIIIWKPSGNDNNHEISRSTSVFQSSVDPVDPVPRKAEKGMMRLNRNAAKLMVRFGANGATDITGFGLLGHANNLAAVQKAEVSIEIRKMPIIRRNTSNNMREKPWTTWKSQCWSSLYHMLRIEIHVWGIHFFVQTHLAGIRWWNNGMIILYIYGASVSRCVCCILRKHPIPTWTRQLHVVVILMQCLQNCSIFQCILCSRNF